MNTCNLCKYSTNIKNNFIRHCKSKNHLEIEERKHFCYTCNKKYKSLNAYQKHKRENHRFDNNTINNIDMTINTNNTDINTNNNNNNNNNNQIKVKLNTIIKSNDTIIKSNDTIIKSNDIVIQNQEEIKEEIIKSKEEVKTVVNKAITKATSLIKYLMEHHQNVPPIKKITDKESIKLLRIDYECPIIRPNDFALERALVYDHSRGRFVKNISKSLLNIINHKKPKKQPIYNTDSTRYNYVIKTTSESWDEDKAGIKFSEYIIKPFLASIGIHIKNFRVIKLESVNMRNNTLYQNEKHIDALGKTLNLESDIMNETLIAPILKELAPHLRYLQSEIEDLEKYNEMMNIQSELEEIIKNHSHSSSSNSESESSESSESEEEDLKPKKIIKKKIKKDSSDDDESIQSINNNNDNDDNDNDNDDNDNYINRYRRRI